MSDDSASSSRDLSVRRDQPIALRQSNPLVARGLQNIVQLGMLSAEGLLQRAKAYYDNGEYDEAIAAYTQVIRLWPTCAEAYRGRGNAFREKGNYDEAIADYSGAITLDPKDAISYRYRGSAYCHAGKYDEAIADFSEAVRLAPNLADAYYHRGFAYSKKGEYNKAYSDAFEAIKLDPQNVRTDTLNAIARGLAAMYPALGLADSRNPWADILELVKRGPRPIPQWHDFIEEAFLELMAKRVAECKRCPALVANRTQTVFGVGNPRAKLVFIGEAPGPDEDRLGEPFVGRAGRLLTDIITKGMKLRREDVYLMNVLCCRPPDNRTPLPAEAANCHEYFVAQLDIIQPAFICCLGASAAQNLLKVDAPIEELRGRIIDFKVTRLLCTFHPAYLLRNPAAKRQVWEDIQILMGEMGLK